MLLLHETSFKTKRHIINFSKIRIVKNIQLKESDIKNCKYYHFDDIVNVNGFNPKNIKVDKKKLKRYSHLLYWIWSL